MEMEMEMEMDVENGKGCQSCGWNAYSFFVGLGSVRPYIGED